MSLDPDYLTEAISLLPTGFITDSDEEEDVEAEQDTSNVLMDAVSVFIKFKPTEVKASDAKASVTFTKEQITTKHKNKTFNFDRVFTPTAPQTDLYNAMGPDMVQKFLRGINCSILTYGQVGTGKTVTMMGSDLAKERGFTSVGIIPRLFEDLWAGIEQRRELLQDHEYTLQMSFTELYLDTFHDLLADPNEFDAKFQQIKMRMFPIDEETGLQRPGMRLTNTNEVTIHDLQDLQDLLAIGQAARHTAKIGANTRSSRGHAIIKLCLTTKRRITEDVVDVSFSTMFLVDLAGSTLMRNFAADASRLDLKYVRIQEATQNNASLSQLGAVFKAITAKADYIPFRNSKLTMLLAETLNGSSFAALIVTCSLDLLHADETMAALRFAEVAKLVERVEQQEKSYSKKQIKAMYAVCKLESKRLEELQKQLGTEVTILQEMRKYTDTSTAFHPAFETKQRRLTSTNDWVANLNPNESLPRRSAVFAPTAKVRVLVKHLRCPLSHHLLTHPVIASDGFTYQREAIEAWIDEHNRSPHPRSSAMLTHGLIPNVSMKLQVQRFFPFAFTRNTPFVMSDIHTVPTATLKLIFEFVGRGNWCALSCVCADFYFVLWNDAS